MPMTSSVNANLAPIFWLPHPNIFDKVTPVPTIRRGITLSKRSVSIVKKETWASNLQTADSKFLKLYCKTKLRGPAYSQAPITKEPQNQNTFLSFQSSTQSFYVFNYIYYYFHVS